LYFCSPENTRDLELQIDWFQLQYIRLYTRLSDRIQDLQAEVSSHKQEIVNRDKEITQRDERLKIVHRQLHELRRDNKILIQQISGLGQTPNVGGSFIFVL
jgi:uncharacterized protein (DUF3084 family)